MGIFALSCCCECGAHCLERDWLTKMLSHQEAKRFYDRFGAKQDWQRFYEHSAVEQLVQHLALGDARAVYELGCGTGSLARELLDERLPRDARYTAVDVSETMVRLARGRLASYAERAEVIQSTGEMELGAESGSVDRFICVYVLDLLSEQDIGKLLAEAHRILVPGGLIGLASLTHGCTPASRVIEKLWVGLHGLNPSLVGGCRPIELLDFVLTPTWDIRHHGVLSRYGMASEIVVAEKPRE